MVDGIGNDVGTVDAFVDVAALFEMLQSWRYLFVVDAQ
jgi:hypothetical protein